MEFPLFPTIIADAGAKDNSFFNPRRGTSQFPVAFFRQILYNDRANPGVAQLVGRLVWVLEHQVGSTIAPTRKPVATLALFLLDFSPALV